ncbi:MAG: hypothetical protein ACHQ9S_21170 [Candidatus Binatia bacterium]
MDEADATQGQVYVSGWHQRLVTSSLLPGSILRAVARVAAAVMRRRIRMRDRLEAAREPSRGGDRSEVIYFADIYHGGATFWDWVVLRGGGLWWSVLWPLVINTSVERLRLHPELRTVLELDAQTYEELEQHAVIRGKRSPLRALRAAVADGRMEIVNGTYVQPLAPTIGSEANIRHFFYGLNTVERILHAKVDSFVAGEPQFFPQLPQVLRGFGIGNAVLRTHWAPFGTDPAADAEIVHWRGPDGSVVRTVPRYGFMDYRLLLDGHPGVQNAGLTGDDFEQWPDERKGQFATEAARVGIHRPFITRLADPKPPESPFPSLLTAARQHGSRLVTIREYFDLPRGDAPVVSYAIDDIPTTIPWGLAGEELHRAQVRAESTILLAERLDAVAQTTGARGRQEDVDASWKLLLRSQHHDLHLCSPWHSTRHNVSMGEVGRDFAQRSTEQAEAVTAAALEVLAHRFGTQNPTSRTFLLFNPSPWPRREFVQLPASADAEVWQRDTQLVTQPTSDGVGFLIDLPPLGMDVVELRSGMHRAVERGRSADLAASTDLIEKEFGSGLVTGGYLTVWRDGLHRSTVERTRIEEDGPLFRRYRMHGRLLDLSFVQSITVIPPLRRIELSTEIDFGSGQHLGPQLADHHSELAYYIQDDKKLCLNFDSALTHLFCDSPFLLVEPHGPRVTALSFIGVEGSGSGGAALLHKGTPGWHVDRQQGVLRNVLAWGPEQWLYASDDSVTPGRSRYTAVRGTHRYEHAITPISTRLDAVRAAHDFRLPVLAVDVPGGEGGRRLPWSFLETAPQQAVLTALFARNGKTYARLWNAGDQPVEFAVSGPHTGTGVSFRLEAESPSGWPSARPWGIQTILLHTQRSGTE